MKSKFLAIALLAIVAGFGSCKKTEEKSKACDIESFTVSGDKWQISGLNITGSYSKGANVSSLTPVIVVSKGASWKASSNPPHDFSEGKTVSFTVTAEDGKATKTYTAQATVN